MGRLSFRSSLYHRMYQGSVSFRGALRILQSCDDVPFLELTGGWLESRIDPDDQYEFSAPMRMRLDEVISGVKTDLRIKVYGDSLPLLQEKAQVIAQIVPRVPGAADASVGVSAGALQLEVVLDRTAIARYGLKCGGRARGCRNRHRGNDCDGSLERPASDPCRGAP